MKLITIDRVRLRDKQIDPRRIPELMDSRMIQEDQQEIANLSRRFINREYPRSSYIYNEYVDDGIRPFPPRKDSE